MTYGSGFGSGFGPGRERFGREDPTGSPQTRIGDAERQQVVDRLIEAHGLGQLDLDEFDQRSGEAWKAKTRGDLVPLTADLPSTTPVVIGRPSAGPRGGAKTPFAALGWLKMALLAVLAVMVVGVVVGQFFVFWWVWLIAWLVFSGRVGGRRWSSHRPYQRY